MLLGFKTYIVRTTTFIWPNGIICYFTNLFFPEMARGPISLSKPPFGGNRSCEVAIIWPDEYHFETAPSILHGAKHMVKTQGRKSSIEIGGFI